MRRLLAIAVSAVLLAVLYARTDFKGIVGALAAGDSLWMTLGLAGFVPLLLLPAWRLQWLVPSAARPTLTEALRLVAMASSLNLVMPSKTGDLAKAYFFAERGRLTGPTALALMAFEKAADLLAMLAWCALALGLAAPSHLPAGPLALVLLLGVVGGSAVLGSRRLGQGAFALGRRLLPGRLGAGLARLEEGWQEAYDHLAAQPARTLSLVLLTIVLWGFHLVQIYAFARALGADLSFLTHVALAPLAILAGLVPFTMTGIGPRDAALVVLYQPYMPVAAAAALGWLCTLRYLVPAAIGLPFLAAYLGRTRDAGVPT